MTEKTEKHPVFFIPHGGGPCFFMDWNPADEWNTTEAFLKSIPSRLKERPKAILLISAHWEEDEFTLLGKSDPALLFDYYGFPDHTYRLTYPAQNPQWVIDKVKTLLQSAGTPVETDLNRDYDHGVFIPLKVAFPDADIPVAQLSIKSNLDPQDHIDLGKTLAPLREQGVLIIGSGMSYHNLRKMMTNSRNPNLEADQDSIAFDEWLSHAVTQENAHKRNALLADWKNAPGAKSAHPREEHLIPLMVIAGAATSTQGKHVFKDTVMGSRISAFEF